MDVRSEDGSLNYIIMKKIEKLNGNIVVINILVNNCTFRL